MREIIFRGKRTDNGEWYFGYFLRFESLNGSIIWGGDFGKTVIPETVGQFTGLTDVNGKRIFEGDIVKIITPIGHERGRVVFREGSFCVKTSRLSVGYITMKRTDGRSFEVIGNKHDNPELYEREARK